MRQHSISTAVVCGVIFKKSRLLVGGLAGCAVMGLTRPHRHRQELGTVTGAGPDTSLGQLTCTL